MTIEQTDPLDTDLQQLFAAAHPAAGFEDRLVDAVRQQRRLRLTIPGPIRRAAIAAAAVIAVGTTGYYGNRAITGNWNKLLAASGGEAINPGIHSARSGASTTEDDLLQITPSSNADRWDFGGGSNSTQNWKNWGDDQKNLSYSYENPFAGGKAVSNGWELKNPDASYAVAGEINVRSAQVKSDVQKSLHKRAEPDEVKDLGVKGLASAASHPQDGQNVVFGDGHAEWDNNPYCGTQHDNVFTGLTGGKQTAYPFVSGGSGAEAKKASPYDNMDSVFLPEATVEGEKQGQSPLSDSVAKGREELHRLQAIDASTKFGNEVAAGLKEQNRRSGETQDKVVVSDRQAQPQSSAAADTANKPASNTYFGGTSIASGNLSLGGNVTGINYYQANTSATNLPPDSGVSTYGFRNSLAGVSTSYLSKAPQAVSGTPQLPTLDLPAKPESGENAKADQPAALAFQYTNGHAADANAPQVAAQSAPAQPANPAAATTQTVDDRKIIRTGSMEFEVDRFDSAQVQIAKIVGELGGFVGATDSTKLPNGKVRGSIVVRVAPERLDTLVLSLRALGDLKSQQITAADITKEYTDLESELTADRAMQDRLLELIHNGKGSVKDLLAAENELGVWRTKIEKAEGMIRYYNAQVALSTLAITLSERDIQTPATAVETETADVGIEAEDVEKSRTAALKAIDDVKGRVVEAELKRFDAGQLAARLVADVPPDSAGAVIDQLKLLGKVARLEIHRQQTSGDGTNAVTADTPLKTERKPTRLLISIYNLANVASRRTTNVSLAAADVEVAYTALAAAAKSNGGRVVTSALDRGDPVKATGSLVLEFPPDKFESAMTALHAQGDVLKLSLTENPDTQNSTEAKVGLTVQLVALAAVPPRESVQQTLAASDVATAYQAVVNAAEAAHARVQSAQLNEQDRQNVTADLQLEVPRTAQADFDKSLAAAGGTIARTASRSTADEGTVDSKVALHLSITSTDHLAPRETTRLQVETPDVDKSAADAQAAALTAGGRVLQASVNKDNGKGLARIILDLPLDKSAEVLQQLRGEGTVRGIDASRDPQAPAGALAHAQIFVEFQTTEAIVADQTGPWASIRQGLSTSVRGLLWSLQWVVVGVCFIAPWAVIGWIILRMKARMTKPRAEK